MDAHSAVALALAVVVLAASPGPGVLATVSQALFDGARSALWVIAGIVCGDVCYLLLAAWGLAAAAEAMGGLFLIVRFAGAALLIVMGLNMWRARAETGLETVHAQRSPWQCMAAGLSITLGNPKVIVFYTALLPAFLDMRTLDGWGILQAAAIVALVLGLVLAAYALAAARASRLLRGPRARTWFNRGAGTVMISAGVSVAAR